MPYRYAVDTLQRITLHYYSTGTSITILKSYWKSHRPPPIRARVCLPNLVAISKYSRY